MEAPSTERGMHIEPATTWFEDRFFSRNLLNLFNFNQGLPLRSAEY